MRVPAQPSLSAPTANEGLSQRVAEQKARYTNLVERATQLSQAAEGSEPLVKSKLLFKGVDKQLVERLMAEYTDQMHE